MTIDIDIAQIAEALNDKADIGLGNTVGHLSESAKQYFTEVSLPSTKYINLTLSSTSGDLYTAPADGYIFVEWNNITSNSGGSSLDIQDPAIRTYSSDTGWQRHCLPIQKGQQFRVYWGSTTDRTLQLFRLYYAEGVK